MAVKPDGANVVLTKCGRKTGLRDEILIWDLPSAGYSIATTVGWRCEIGAESVAVFCGHADKRTSLVKAVIAIFREVRVAERRFARHCRLCAQLFPTF